LLLLFFAAKIPGWFHRHHHRRLRRQQAVTAVEIAIVEPVLLTAAGARLSPPSVALVAVAVKVHVAAVAVGAAVALKLAVGGRIACAEPKPEAFVQFVPQSNHLHHLINQITSIQP
jgi:hypothetical protein